MGEDRRRRRGRRAMANGVVITSETRRVELVEPRRRSGGPGKLVLRLAMTECHTWVGIGGRTARVRRPRRFSRHTSVALDDGGGEGPDYLRSGGGEDCRRLIGWAIKQSLMREKGEEEEEYRRLTPAHWDQAVPADVERHLSEHGGGACEARVDISVRFEFQYSERSALLRACYENGGDQAARTGNGDGDGEAASCAICFEEMALARDEVTTGLPGCTHGFHRRCIGAWFHKASTCPVCRRDQRQFLPKEYRDLHDVMARDSDGCLPDYL